MISMLPMKYREVMIESVYLQKDNQEIALALGLSPANARQIKSRAKKLLLEMKENEETTSAAKRENQGTREGKAKEVEVDKEGFGCYTLNLDLMNGKKSAAAVLEMKRGRISITSDSSQCLSPLIGRFFTEQQGEAMGEEDRKTLIEEIEKLPDSSHLYLSLSNQKPQDVAALLKQTNDDLELEWLQVYQPENEFQAGVGIYSNVIGPNWDVMPEQVTAERLKREYLENLKLLKENQDAWKGLELYSGDSIWAESEKDQLLQKAISAAEQSSEFQTKNYCVSGTKTEILAFLQKGSYNRIDVDNVQYSILM